VGADAEQKRDDDAVNRRLYAARKGQRRHGRGGEIKRDSNEVGDRNH
jgi:hypothetical protein